MFNLEGFIPKLCQLAQELGDEERARQLRSAGLQVLSSLVFSLKLSCHLKFLLTTIMHLVSVTIDSLSGVASEILSTVVIATIYV